MNKIFNFSAGPSMLPVDVLKKAQRESFNWNNLGTSVMEISHRSERFYQMMENAKRDLRDLLDIPLNYKILFCHGGGRAQFSAVPLNLLGNNCKADYINTGYWAYFASKEGRKYCSVNMIDVRIIKNGKNSIKPMDEWRPSKEAAYLHFCQNETIDGITIYEVPNFHEDIIVTADVSSIILSSPLLINRFGLVYASSQKNIGPPGFALIIIREDLLGRTHKICPSILDYTLLDQHNSIFNTPSIFSWYISSLVFKWLKNQGGVTAINAINQKKAKLLYNVIDNSDLYYNNVDIMYRSCMNVPFQLKNHNLDQIFLKESFSAGLHELHGHRVVGGMRASIYNAMPLSGVQALADFMIDFERRHG